MVSRTGDDCSAVRVDLIVVVIIVFCRIDAPTSGENCTWGLLQNRNFNV